MPDDQRDPNWMKGIADSLRFPPKEKAENEKLTPERAVRLLLAKAGELEAIVLDDDIRGGRGSTDLCADIALVAQLLADHIEHTMSLEKRLQQIDADLWTRLDALERYALADAEHGVRGDPESMAPLVEARRDLLAKHHQQQRRNWPQQYPKPTWPVENQKE